MTVGNSPWIDEELGLIQDHVARFIVSELVPHREQWDREGRTDRESWRKAGRAGLLCPSIPEAYGGSGGTLAHEAIVQQELARAGLGGNFGVGHMVHSAIVAHYILGYGTEDQKARWLPPMATGEVVAAVAMTEPGTGSDLRGIRSTAEPCEGGYRLRGQKTFITNGQNADLVLVVARTGQEDGSASLSLFGVRADSPGFSRGRNLEKIGMHGQDTSELFFDDVFLASEDLLGLRAGEGMRQLTQQLAWERLGVAINAAVNMERAVELATTYARERQVFGKSLFDFQNTQFLLADAKARAVVGRACVDQFMVELLAGDLTPERAAIAKLWLAETSFSVIDACQQLFGGYGYMAEYPIARLFADARVMRIYGGTSEIMKLIIGRSL